MLVPVAAWPCAPQHRITCVLSTQLAPAAIVTGSESGQLVLWCRASKFATPTEPAQENAGAGPLTPRTVLFGHGATIVWLAQCAYESSEAIASLCREGHANAWDPADGRCLSASAAPLLGDGTRAVAATILPGRTHAVIAGETAALHVLDLSGMRCRVLVRLPDWPLAVAAAPAGLAGSGAEEAGAVRIACVDAARMIRLWDVPADTLMSTSDGAARPRPATAYTPVPLSDVCIADANGAVGADGGSALGVTEAAAQDTLSADARFAALCAPRTVHFSDDLTVLLIHHADGCVTVSELGPPIPQLAQGASAPPFGRGAGPLGGLGRRRAVERGHGALGRVRQHQLIRLEGWWEGATLVHVSEPPAPPAGGDLPAAARPPKAPHSGWHLLAWGGCDDAGTTRPPSLFRLSAKGALQPAATFDAESRSSSRDSRAGPDLVDALCGRETSGSTGFVYTAGVKLIEPLVTGSAVDAATTLVMATTVGDLHLFRAAPPQSSAAGGRLASPPSPHAPAPMPLALILTEGARLDRGWRAVDPVRGRVTTMAHAIGAAAASCLLVGYEDGSVGRFELPSGERCHCSPAARHAAPVTALVALRGAAIRSSDAPQGQQVGDRRTASRTFASADALGTVTLWSLSGLSPLASVQEHTRAVTALLQPPLAAEAPAVELMPGGVPDCASLVSIGTDGAVALYSLSGEPFDEIDEDDDRAAAAASAPPNLDASSGVSVRCALLLPGHALPVVELCWRMIEGLLLCRAAAAPSSPSTLYAWQLSTGRLERVIDAAEAAPQLKAMASGKIAGCHCQPVPDTVGPLGAAAAALRGGASIGCAAMDVAGRHGCDDLPGRIDWGAQGGPVFASGGYAPFPPLCIFVFHVRRLIAEARREVAARDAPRDAAREVSQRTRESMPGARLQPTRPSTAAGVPFDDAWSVSEIEGPSTLRVAPLAGQSPPLPTRSASLGPTTALACRPMPGSSQLSGVAACRLTLAYLSPWGADDEFDHQLALRLGIEPPGACLLAFGVCGHGGRLSFCTPTVGQTVQRWASSAHLSGVSELSLAAVANTMATGATDEQARHACAKLVQHVAVSLAARLPNRCAPSLSLLARHSVDPSEDVQTAARLLLDSTLGRLPQERRRRLVEAWLGRLLSPSTAPLPLAPMTVSAAGLASGAPMSMSGHFSRSASAFSISSLTSSTTTSPQHVRPPAARQPSTVAPSSLAELSSPQGIAVLLLSAMVIRYGAGLHPDLGPCLVSYLLGMLHGPSEAQRAAAADLLSRGYTEWRPYLGDRATLIRTLFAAAHSAPAGRPLAASEDDVVDKGSTTPTAAGGPSRLTPQASAGAPAALSANRYHTALIVVGAAEPQLLCTEMGEQAVRMAAPPRVRLAAVASVISLVRSRAASLETSLPQVVEAALRPLDPSVPSLREGSLGASTSALRELVRRYPMVHFNQPTQRLAVGTVEGVVLLYDVRTATKWRILQGHGAPVTSVSIAPAGDLVASYCAEERVIRWWSTGSSGLFGFLGLSGNCLGESAVDVEMPIGARVQIEWASPHSVGLTCNNIALGFFTRP